MIFQFLNPLHQEGLFTKLSGMRRLTRSSDITGHRYFSHKMWKNIAFFLERGLSSNENVTKGVLSLSSMPYCDHFAHASVLRSIRMSSHLEICATLLTLLNVSECSRRRTHFLGEVFLPIRNRWLLQMIASSALSLGAKKIDGGLNVGGISHVHSTFLISVSIQFVSSKIKTCPHIPGNRYQKSNIP